MTGPGFFDRSRAQRDQHSNTCYTSLVAKARVQGQGQVETPPMDNREALVSMLLSLGLSDWAFPSAGFRLGLSVFPLGPPVFRLRFSDWAACFLIGVFRLSPLSVFRFGPPVFRLGFSDSGACFPIGVFRFGCLFSDSGFPIRSSTAQVPQIRCYLLRVKTCVVQNKTNNIKHHIIHKTT